MEPLLVFVVSLSVAQYSHPCPLHLLHRQCANSMWMLWLFDRPISILFVWSANGHLQFE